MAKVKVVRKTRPAQSLKVYKDEVGEWRWQIKARNGKLLANGGEGYANKQDCLAGMLAVLKVLFADLTEHLTVCTNE